MSHVVQFHPNVAKQLNRQVSIAKRIWREAEPTLTGLRIAAGNYAGYGAYSAMCHPSGIVEIPVGNSFSLLEFDRDNQLVHGHADHRVLLGILLHEIGHHVINTAQQKPWEDNIQVGPSTHYTRAWVWVCCMGWNSVSNVEIDPNDFARVVKKDTETMGEWLTGFNPYFPPKFLVATIDCDNCGESFKPKRADSKFCSGKCRVAAHRSARWLKAR